MKLNRIALFTTLLAALCVSIAGAAFAQDNVKPWTEQLKIRKFNGSGGYTLYDTSSVTQSKTDTIFVDMVQRMWHPGLSLGQGTNVTQIMARLWVEKITASGADSIYTLISPGLLGSSASAKWLQTTATANFTAAAWTGENLITVGITENPTAVSTTNFWGAQTCRLLVRGPATGGAAQYRVYVSYYIVKDDD